LQLRKFSFTLIELLVVIGIIALLAAILFPVFAQTRGKARESVCLSNLQQIGAANLMYASDWDDRPVWGGDPVDLSGKAWPGNSDVENMKPQHVVLMPYLKNKDVWHCPADIGYDYFIQSGTELPAHPTSFKVYGSSYGTRTEIILLKRAISSLEAVDAKGNVIGPAGIGFFFDASDEWHGSGSRTNPSQFRCTTAFLDGHAKSLVFADYHNTWAIRIR
jgi:prepilin-type N-terminal cleavage/methylation domain-containing protein